ncbi:MAG: HEAT repeat domain-containing protein [Planctomycetes bacterium]|nr:HEAT repeat domain-containing protein [Planctomycetota bacterium]
MNGLALVVMSIHKTRDAAVQLLTALRRRSMPPRHSVLLAAVPCLLAGQVFTAVEAGAEEPETLSAPVLVACEQTAPNPLSADETPKPEEIEEAKQLFRNSRDNSAARAKAARVLYPLIKPGTPRSDVLNYLGAPDPFPKRESYSRFLNYVIGDDKRIEIEFDRNQEKVARKQEIGLGIDPPRLPTPPIPDKLQAYVTDYVVDAKNKADRTVLRAGFIPDKSQIVWGEPLALAMTVANIGDADFEFMFGGDYRGTGRHDRIKITITDADGNELPDPHANAPDFGGILWREIITPGGLNFTHTLDLAKFRIITGPGSYTVNCRFAFGEPHTPAGDQAEVVIKSSFPFTILARTPERVAAVLDELHLQVAAAADDHLPEAIAALARFGKDDAIHRLNVYTRTGTTAQRIAAFGALPLVPGEAAVSIALAGLSDADPTIRMAAYSSLGRMPERRSMDALLDAVTRETSPVREAVLVALGTSKSSRALPVLSRTLEEGPAEFRFAAISALVQFGGPDAIASLRPHTNSQDWAFRYQVVNALVTDLHSPLNPEWLLPIMMCRRHNNREWLDSLSLVRIRSEDKAVPVLLSCVDYDVPWSHRNFWILHHVKYAKGAPEFDYLYDPNSPGTPEQHEKNRQTLEALRPLAGPIPEPTDWPARPVPSLKTSPQIDFTTTLTAERGAGETLATVRCGFFEETWNRRGGSVSFKPSEAFQATYQVAEDVRAILASPERAQKSGLTELQLQELRKLQIPPQIPVIQEGLSLLYIWWQESPEGPIRQRAQVYLCERVRADVQQHHADHVAFASAARKIMGSVESSTSK